MKDITTGTLILSYLARFLGLFLILFSLMAAYLGFSTLSSISRDGTLGFNLGITSDTKAILITSIEQDLPAYDAGLRAGDTLTKFNGKPVTQELFNNEVARGKNAGEKTTVTLLKNGVEREIELTYVRSGVFDKLVSVLFRTIPVLLMALYVLVGFWGLLRSPYSKETILIALFCFCFGAINYATVNTGLEPDNFVRKYLYFDDMKKFVSIIMWLGPSFWLYLFATFPSRSRFYEKNKAVSLIFISLLPLVMVLSIFGQSSMQWVGIMILVLLFVNMGVGVLLLANSSKRVESVLEKRQIRLMLFGIKYGALSVGIGWIEVLLVQQFLAKYMSTTLLLAGFMVFLVCQIGGLIIPFTFLNSFFQNKLLETQSALKRRVRYIGFTLGLLAIYLFAIFIMGHLLVKLFDVKDTTLIIVLVLLLSLTFTPINKRLLKWIDEKFYPERTKYAESLKNFIQVISSQIDKNDILLKLKEWMQATTHIYPVIPVTFDGNPAMFYPFRQDESNSVINKIKNGAKFFWDEVTVKYTAYVNEEEIEWARDNDISLSIPMISQGELVGVLNVGKKQGENDFTMEDIDLLSQASSQTALALQNMKLQSEYIEKKRMDKELDMARRIQKNLMPKDIPSIKGLDIYGESRPCFEVAGDYFDIISLEDGNTVLVVADVSGKGAGAAMIMANLQASMRLGVQLSDVMSDFVTRINNLIYSNTSSSEFITFFFAVWNPENKRLHYVNAGHNPPVVIDKPGSVTKLDATGLIIGILPDQVYEEKSILLKEGSVVVIYTDGLDEAMNKESEQFGLEKIIETIKEHRDKSAKEISESLSNKVLEFCSGTPMHDDVTLIVAKGL
jgi:serine phosphatase RsbU (regulator of sigma subunit)